MSALFERLKTDLPDGWCSEQKAEMLAASVMALRPLVTVSIGVWFGRSTSAMALAHKELGRGLVWAIDPWSKAASVDGMTNAADVKFWGEEVDHEVVYQSFLTSVTKLSIQNVTKVVRSKSSEVAPPVNIGIVDADGNHGPEAVADAQRFGPHVSLGGLWIADDLGWTGNNVEKSLLVLEQLGFKELYRVNDKSNVWAVWQRYRT